MRLTRQSRTLTALIALISLLFMQMAFAAHPCHAVQTPLNRGVPQATAMVMSDCGMQASSKSTEEDLGLCHEHCAQGKQSLDRTPAPDVTPFHPVLLPQCPQQTVAVATPLLTHYQDASLVAREAPSLAIRHCCFRI